MSILRAYGSLWVDRALVRLLVGEFVSSIGDWLYLVALLVIVYDKSGGDTVLLGVVGAARVIPYVILSVPAGIAADRFDRRLILLSTDLARGAIMVGLAALVALNGPLWAVVALSILATCFSSFFGPTIGAFLPSLVGDESRLGPANSAWASLDNLAFIIGPAIGGILIAGSGLAFAFLLNAVSFGLVAAVLWRLPSTRGRTTSDPTAEPEATGAADPTGAADGSPAADGALVPGAATVPAAAAASPARATQRDDRPSPSLRPVLVPILGLGLLNVVGSFAFGGLSILTVVLAGSAFGSGEEATGYLNAAIGVGGLIGAVVAGALVLRPGLAPPLLGGAALIGAGFAGLGLVGSLGPALVAMAVASGGSLLVEVVDATIFQRVVPDELRGRALGGIATAATLALAAGSFSFPILAGTIGVQALLMGAGAAVVAAAVVAAFAVGAHATRPVGPDEALLRHVAGLPIFAGVAAGNLESVLRRRRMRDVSPGEVVIRQGDEPDRFAIIVAGRFDVTRQEPGAATPNHLRVMGVDDVFGEIGLLTRARRSATVTATTEGRLLELEGADFLELVAAGPGLSSRFLDLYRGGRAVRPTTHG